MAMQSLVAMDNAMLFKDVTQWLRRKTFVLFFIVLIALAEASVLMLAMVPTSEQQKTGAILFGILAAILGIFTLIIAIQANMLTSREFKDRTFELYALSGMSLERMVWGKFISMIGQFLFILFTLAPFMFVAFLMRGLDFYSVFATLLTILFFVPLIYIVSLLLAFLARRKAVSALVRLAAVLLPLFLAQSALVYLFGISVTGGGTSGPVALLKGLLAFNSEAWTAFGLMLLYYFQIFLFLFYAACNAISPPSDTRDTALKTLASSLCLSFILMTSAFVWVNGPFDMGGIVYGFVLAPLLLITCGIGVFSILGNFNGPVMARKREAEAKRFRRILYTLAPSGAKGGLRVLLLICLMMGAFLAFLYFYVHFYSLTSRGTFSANSRDHFKQVVALSSTVLMVPFFIAVPGALLMNLKSFQRRPAGLRAFVIVFWVLVIPFYLILGTFIEANLVTDALDAPLQIAGLFISPITAVLPADYTKELLFVRLAAGAFGVFLLFRTLQKRKNNESPAK